MNHIRLSNLTIVILTFVFLAHQKLSAQPIDSSLAYYPMQVGDIWEYYGYMISTTPYYSLHLEITGDTLAANGFTYQIFEERNSSTGTTIYWKRLDSLSGSTYKRLPPDTTEIQDDSLRAHPGDFFRTYSYDIKGCTGQGVDTIFGFPIPVKSFGGGVNSPSYKLAYGIGMSYWTLDDGASIGLQIRKIVYAKVGSVAYGTPLRISVTTTTPINYLLNQNYPNPFNPSTTIEYFLPKRSSVKLTIINVIGQRISEWIYSDRAAGRYSFIWTPQLPSGIYFCRLEAISNTQPVEHYTVIRKMLLLK